MKQKAKQKLRKQVKAAMKFYRGDAEKLQTLRVNMRKLK